MSPQFVTLIQYPIQETGFANFRLYVTQYIPAAECSNICCYYSFSSK